MADTPHRTDSLDTLGHKLGEAALTLLVRLYPQVRQASNAQLDAACAAMRAQVGPVLDELLTEAREAPTVAHVAFQSAALSLAQAGIQALKDSRK
ncbi:hypothetical protein HW932_12490 [Allochromatium humboldtianum]|uniref:Uncharacterized protein n=1 Tax=Allochromatium humboldtianum TaxID=504901 RepID=A0A850R9W1_9GAMM|nr:hypothetical protein [Allochromatium humboldtianum]